MEYLVKISIVDTDGKEYETDTVSLMHVEDRAIELMKIVKLKTIVTRKLEELKDDDGIEIGSEEYKEVLKKIVDEEMVRFKSIKTIFNNLLAHHTEVEDLVQKVVDIAETENISMDESKTIREKFNSLSNEALENVGFLEQVLELAKSYGI